MTRPCDLFDDAYTHLTVEQQHLVTRIVYMFALKNRPDPWASFVQADIEELHGPKEDPR